MEYINAMQWRYATKKFDATKYLEKDKLDRILSAANLSATSMGLQPIKILNIENATIKTQLQPLCYNQPQPLDASNVLVICVETDLDDNKVNEYIELISKTRNVATVHLHDFSEMIKGWINGLGTQENKMNWASKQAYITLGNLLDACAMEKVDSCPMEGFLPDAISELLGLQELNLHPIILLPIGYRHEEDANQHAKKVRKPMSEFVINF